MHVLTLNIDFDAAPADGDRCEHTQNLPKVRDTEWVDSVSRIAAAEILIGFLN